MALRLHLPEEHSTVDSVNSCTASDLLELHNFAVYQLFRQLCLILYLCS